MARSYSAKFLNDLTGNPSGNLGVQLARLCVEAGIPASYIAAALKTSRITVYGWFRGQGIRESKRREVEVLIDLIGYDLEQKDGLPAKDIGEAKSYIEKLAGIKIG